jgi:RNA polymerase sigma factor (TIGR02999 family)
MDAITQVLKAIEQGDPHAAEQLLPLVYDELRKLAAEKLAQEKPGQTLQATALVHEAYLRLVGAAQTQDWDGRGHFFAAAAEAMRRILIDRARHKQTRKAGGGRRRLDLDNIEPVLEDENGDRLLVLNEASWSNSGFSPASPPSRRPPHWASPPPPPKRTGPTPAAGSGS